MLVAVLVIGGAISALVALGALLTLGLGPVAALVVVWLGGLAATVALAAGVARSMTLTSAGDESKAPTNEGI